MSDRRSKVAGPPGSARKPDKSQEPPPGRGPSSGGAIAVTLDGTPAVLGGDEMDPTRKADLLMGLTLGEYRVLEPIARGGMGMVYRGEQPVIGKKVAIKVLLPHVAEDPELVHRLVSEARAVNSVRHPNIVDIFGFGQVPDGRHYVVMEYLEGEPLLDLAVRRVRLEPEEVETVLDQTAAALEAAHGAGVIHRDLKPGNIFVTTLPDGRWHIKLLDFGLAKTAGATSFTNPELIMGTPGYMAPEQILGGQATPQTDLYSLGVVAYRLLAGHPPFEGKSEVDTMRRQVDEAPPPLRSVCPECPDGLADLVMHLIEKDPAQRPASAAFVRRELARIRRDRARDRTVLAAPGAGLGDHTPTQVAAVARAGPVLVPRPGAPHRGQSVVDTQPEGQPAEAYRGPRIQDTDPDGEPADAKRTALIAAVSLPESSSELGARLPPTALQKQPPGPRGLPAHLVSTEVNTDPQRALPTLPPDPVPPPTARAPPPVLRPSRPVLPVRRGMQWWVLVLWCLGALALGGALAVVFGR